MMLSAIQKEKPKLFKKKNELNDLQLSVQINENGHKHNFDEDDFATITIESIIDECTFNTSVIPIEMIIQEWD